MEEVDGEKKSAQSPPRQTTKDLEKRNFTYITGKRAVWKPKRQKRKKNSQETCH